MKKDITLKEFRYFFDLSCSDIPPKEKDKYIEEVKWLLIDIGCPNKNETKITLELDEFNFEDKEYYSFSFYYKDNEIWTIDTYDSKNKELIKLGDKINNEYLYRNQLVLNI